MTIDPSALPGGFGERRPIGEQEVLQLRRTMWADGSISPDEAEQLFDLNDAASPDNGWTDFFVEAMCDYLIARGQPRGYVTEADAQWLARRIDRDGRIESHAELELIVKLLERAESVPESLKQFALAEIERTVLTGSGPTRRSGPIAAGIIDEAEVTLLRRLVFASGGDGPAKVSRSEAEMLFRIKDATLGANNDSGWQQLFIQGVANHLMAHQDYAPPAPDIAARLDEEYRSNPLARAAAVFASKPAGVAEARKAVFGDEDLRIAAHDASVAADAQVNSEESQWLTRLFEADGARDPIEQALLDFIAVEGVRPL